MISVTPETLADALYARGVRSKFVRPSGAPSPGQGT